jgi:hypothetical protein
MMIVRVFGAVLALWLLSGCSGMVSGVKDAEGWSQRDRTDFLKIYRDDTYVSACGLDPLYRQYETSKDSAILTRLFVGYVRNLANSCIDLGAFRAAQAAQKARGVKTHFQVVTQPVSTEAIQAQLKKGVPVAQILEPYIPKDPQFAKLLAHYKPDANDPRQQTIRINLERLKLVDPNSWDTYIEINVPEYTLRFFEGGSVTMQFPIIVGKPAWQTPIFSSTMKYIVLNPTWTMTSNIVRETIDKHLLRDPGYLKRHNMKVYEGFDADAKEVDPRTIDWKKYAGKKNKTPIPYRIVQGSSKKNALGTVKFMFPNRFSVYMHDTQAKSLFKRKKRAFSHGCMRLSQPQALLKKVALSYAGTSMELIEKHKKNAKVSYVNLKRTIPVHIVYQTAYVDGGTLTFFEDVYGLDARMKVRQ